MYISFEAGGTGASCLGEGWSMTEQDYTWATGLRSTLILPALAPCPFGYDLFLKAGPFSLAGQVQALRLVYNGADLGEYELPGPGQITARIPPEMVSGTRGFAWLDIGTRYAASPARLYGGGDTRELSFCLSTLRFAPPVDRVAPTEPAIDGVGDAELMTGFESLGDDCDFAFAQRFAGADPIGVFRWGSMQLHRLAEALETRFEGMDDPDRIDVFIRSEGGPDGEYMIQHKRFGYSYHTFIHSTDMTPDQVKSRELVRLAFGRRKLIEDLEDGAKIFVVKSSSGELRRDQVAAVAERIAAYGASALLWARPQDEDHAAGTIRWQGPNLLEGRVDRLCSRLRPEQDNSPYWLPLCRAAYRAVHGRPGWPPSPETLTNGF